MHANIKIFLNNTLHLKQQFDGGESGIFCLFVGDNHARFGVLLSICSIFTISFFVNLFHSKNSNLPHCFTDLIHTEYRKLHKNNGHSRFVLPPIMRSSVGQCRNIRFRQMYASHVIITSANELANQTVHKRSFFLNRSRQVCTDLYQTISSIFIHFSFYMQMLIK